MDKKRVDQAQLQGPLTQQHNSFLTLKDSLWQKCLSSQPQLQQLLLKHRWQPLVATLLVAGSVGAISWPNHLQERIGSAERYLQHYVRLLRPPAKETGGGDTAEVALALAETAEPSQTQPVDPIKAQTLTPDQKPTLGSPLEGFCHPLKGQGWLSQGNRGMTHQNRMEYAYDHAAPIGTPVYAMRSGKVINLRDHYPDLGGGIEKLYEFNYVWLEHDDGHRSVYIHLQQGFRSKIPLKVGDQVEAGQMIGFSGNSGWSGGPHLHVEVQEPGNHAEFSQTVPFAIADTCNSSDSKIASSAS